MQFLLCDCIFYMVADTQVQGNGDGGLGGGQKSTAVTNR